MTCSVVNVKLTLLMAFVIYSMDVGSRADWVLVNIAEAFNVTILGMKTRQVVGKKEHTSNKREL